MTEPAIDKFLSDYQVDIGRVRHSYLHLEMPGKFEVWLDHKAPAWGMMSARDMIRLGRAQEVIDALDKIYKDTRIEEEDA